MSTHQHDAITAGTPAGTNAASAVTASYLPDYSGIVKPAMKLTYNADPVGGLSAAALYIVEALAGASENCATLQSNCASTTSVLGETADGSVYLAASSARFFVTHNATPAGVQVYVNEAASYQLEFVSPTATDAVILMPMENAAGMGAPFVKVVVHHNAAAATGKALYFDDNGAADAQLVFIAADTSDHAIPASDIAIATTGATTGVTGAYGSAAAQTFTGSALGTRRHAAISAGTPAGTNDAPSITVTPGTYNALGTHQHAAITAGTPAGTNDAPAFTGTPATLTGSVAAPTFTGAALGTHQHAAITAGTPAGSVAAAAFTGTPATLTGSVAAPAFTGAAMSTHTHTSTGGASGEAPAHTDLHLVVIDFVAYGY
jgi:hypothetical protein